MSHFMVDIVVNEYSKNQLDWVKIEETALFERSVKFGENGKKSVLRKRPLNFDIIKLPKKLRQG